MARPAEIEDFIRQAGVASAEPATPAPKSKRPADVEDFIHQAAPPAAAPAAAKADETPPEERKPHDYKPPRVGADLAESPGMLDRGVASARRAAQTFGGGIRAFDEGTRHPIDTITDPSKRRQFERGVDDMVTLGHGQRLAARIGRAMGDTPDVDLGLTEASDASKAPDYRALGNLTGGALPGASSLVGKAGGKIVGALPNPTGATLGGTLGAIKGVAGYEMTAPALAALSAGAKGHRREAAGEAASDPFGILTSAIPGAASGAAGGAKARVNERILREVPHGEATAKLSTATKLAERAGEGGVDLADMLDRDPKMRKELAIHAYGSPARVESKVIAKLRKNKTETDPMYDRIDKAPDPRFTDPNQARPRGGIDIGEVDRSLEALGNLYVSEGRGQAAAAVRNQRDHLARTYGTPQESGPPKVIPGTVIPARSVRNLANEVGETAFAGDPANWVKTRPRAQQEIYHAITETIEHAAEGSGVNVDRLKQLNRDSSILIPISEALKERGRKETAGRWSLYTLLKAGGGGAGAGIGGYVGSQFGGAPGAAVGSVVGGTVGAAVPGVARGVARRLDYSAGYGVARLARLVSAGRAGATVGQLVQMGRDQGMSDEEAMGAAAQALRTAGNAP